jgi:hypothetical protein
MLIGASIALRDKRYMAGTGCRFFYFHVASRMGHH